MVKSTKLVRAISSIITFQKRIPQGIQSVTIKGKEALADLDLDKNYDMDLKLNADKDKLNGVSSSIPYIQATTSISGSVPDEQKSVSLAQDLREFPLTSGELVTVEKTENALTLNDSKVKELVESKTEALKKELGTGTGATAKPITLNGGELVTVDKAGDTLTLNDSKVKELVETTKTEILKKLPVKNTVTGYLYNLYNRDVLNAYYTLSGGDITYSTFILSVFHNNKYDNHFVFIPLNNNQLTKKFSDNTIVRITPNSSGALIELFFKEASEINISGLDYIGQINTPGLHINEMSETYDSLNNSLFATSGNVPQPFDEGYDHL
jgi:hypothetical protein